MLGGKYDEDNLGTMDRDELLRFAGNLAMQINNCPDGTRVRFVIKE